MIFSGRKIQRGDIRSRFSIRRIDIRERMFDQIIRLIESILHEKFHDSASEIDRESVLIAKNDRRIQSRESKFFKSVSDVTYHTMKYKEMESLIKEREIESRESFFLSSVAREFDRRKNGSESLFHDFFRYHSEKNKNFRYRDHGIEKIGNLSVRISFELLIQYIVSDLFSRRRRRKWTDSVLRFHFSREKILPFVEIEFVSFGSFYYIFRLFEIFIRDSYIFLLKDWIGIYRISPEIRSLCR